MILIAPRPVASRSYLQWKNGWYRGKKRSMKFAIPRIWREPTDHSSNCYFCMVDPPKRRAGKNASAIMYSYLPSSIVQVPYCPELLVPTPTDT
ncbi:uncharacterized protein LOC143222906 isoform X2 [Tachypleus tridentatus]|uniref:uncharacterized protein LOC143222906 isoform X2 n=1 Tax=Tachypleus tridentatus TaxID=6853 RepID=UPI003FD66873